MFWFHRIKQSNLTARGVETVSQLMWIYAESPDRLCSVTKALSSPYLSCLSRAFFHDVTIDKSAKPCCCVHREFHPLVFSLLMCVAFISECLVSAELITVTVSLSDSAISGLDKHCVQSIRTRTHSVHSSTSDTKSNTLRLKSIQL